MYAKITFIDHNRNRRTRRILLPFAVGSSPLCDVVIRSKAIAPCLFTAHDNGAEQIRLSLADGQTPFAKERLQHYKMTVEGPYSGDAKKLSLKARFDECLAKERKLGENLSLATRTLLGYRLPQTPRLLMHLAIAAAMVVYGLKVFDRPTNTDRAPQPVPTKVVLGTPTRTAFVSNGKDSLLSAGFDLTMSLDEERSLPESLVMEFRTKGLITAEALSIIWNDKVIWSSKPRSECLKTYCTERLEIPGNHLLGGLNSIKFDHHPPSQPYVVDSVFISGKRELSAFEKAALSHHLKVARRFYDERHIVDSNLIRARRELAAIDRLLIGVSDLEEERATAKLLRISVEDDFEAVVGDLSFRIEQAAKLTKYREAIALGEHLLTLYPDAHGKSYQGIKQYLDQLRRRL